jgi:dolichol-phosphate mannosyltransferase
MSQSDKPLPTISIVVPAYNEQSNVWPCYQAVTKCLAKVKDKYQYELVFLDNHSTDNTFEELRAIAANDSRVRVVRYNRNYGFNKSLLTSFHLARGECVVPLDCDLQDPPELIPEFLKRWEIGHDLVVGVRARREDGVLFAHSRKLFYRLLRRITEDTIVVDAGDFYLVDRSVLNRVRRLYDANPYVRALVSSMAVNIAKVSYNRQPRMNGKSKFPLSKLLSLAVVGIINHSTLPLRLASFFGLIASITTALMAGLFLLGRLFLDVAWPAGYASEIILILFGISLNALFLGIIGEYLCKIYMQLHRRPLTVIESAINLPVEPSDITEC